MTELVKEVKRRNRPDELIRAVRALDKGAQKAIDRLIVLCDSKDEKIALEAASKMLKLLSEMKQQADERDLKALLARVKINGGANPQVPKDDVPLVDFDNLQDPN